MGGQPIMVDADTKIKVGSRIVLYDGVCGLCNGWVKFVLRRDRKNKFLFASLQSDFAYRALSKHNRNPKDLNTVYVIVDYALPTERLLSRAKAVIYVLSEMGGYYKFVGLFNALPEGFLNFGYGLVARMRYQLFGKHDSCMMPEPESSKRFIEV
jgi:predicted DCC family thiol-disulfide oxidoreductase YuxK